MEFDALRASNKLNLCEKIYDRFKDNIRVLMDTGIIKEQVLWLENLFKLNRVDIRKFLLLMHNFLCTKGLCISKESKKKREIEESISEFPRKKYCFWIQGPRCVGITSISV